MRSQLLRVMALALLSLALPCLTRARAEDEPEEPGRPTAKAKSPEAKTPAERKIDECMQLRRSHKFDDAFRALTEAKALNPPPSTSAEILFRTAETWFKKGQEASEEKLANTSSEQCFQQALAALEELLKQYPREEYASEGSYLMGSTQLLLGDLVKAQAIYKKTYDDFPLAKGRGRSLIRIGVCQAGLDDPIGATRTFARFLQEFPGDADKADRTKVGKYIRELSIVGNPAPPLKVSKWLQGMVGPEGLKTFTGEVVVIVFFATWCENCSAEMPHLRSLIHQWAPKGVVFLGVSDPDDPKNTSPVDVYVQKNNIEFLDVALDAGSTTHAAYRVNGLPATVIIDRKGKIRWRGHLAFFPRPLIEKTLAEK